MKIISHRRNTIEELKKTPLHYGVEIDIRSFGYDLIIQHDPYVKGESFTDWLDNFHHSTLILNVKEEGLEARLLDIMKEREINDFFFLDQSIPFLVRLANAGESRSAVRVSEYESIKTAFSFSGKIDWVWVDCFSHFPLNKNEALRLKDSGFKLCLVSPELHGVKADEVIMQFIDTIKANAINPDAVCTKRPDLWEDYF
jgi:hypothetical protein